MQRVFTFILIFIFASVSAFAAEPIAVIIDVSGEASVGREGERGTTALSLKSQVYTKDVVYTGADGYTSLLFKDNSVVTVSSDSELYLADFAYTATSKKFNAKLAKGAMRLITGEITERNPQGFNVYTPHVSAGIRGTILNLLVTDSFTEVAVLNTDKVVIVNGREIRQNQKIIVGDGITPQVTPITAAEKGAILGGGVAQVSASAAQGVATSTISDSELTQNLMRTENPVLPAVLPAIGLISGSINGTYIGEAGITGATADIAGNFAIKFDLQTLAVLYAESNGTWSKTNPSGNSIIGNYGSWSAMEGTGQGSTCGTGICFKVDSWEQPVVVEQNYGQGAYTITKGGVDLQVGVTGKANGSGVVNSSSHLHITQNLTSPCVGGNAGCLTLSGAPMNNGVSVLKLADGDEGSAGMNAAMSGNVQY